jgi:hypothetical protein
MIETASSPDANSCAIPSRIQPVALVLELAQLDQLAPRVLEAFELEHGVAQLSSLRARSPQLAREQCRESA